MTADVETVIYGSINNSFTLAASFVLCSGKPAHVLIVLDGDRYITRKEKESQIMKNSQAQKILLEKSRSKHYR